jgi:hypothetical protein
MRAWFGVFAAPAAWVVQFLVGYGVTEAECNAAGIRWSVPVHTLTVVATVVAALVALAGWGAAALAFRGSRGASSEPPAGRVHFLAAIGLTTSPLFLLVIVWSGVGSLVLEQCHQA